VVRLMTELLEPQEGESIYDPTCGSGGMLLSCAVRLKDQGKEYRTLKLFGQERNLITSSIARMNLFSAMALRIFELSAVIPWLIQS